MSNSAAKAVALAPVAVPATLLKVMVSAALGMYKALSAALPLDKENKAQVNKFWNTLFGIWDDEWPGVMFPLEAFFENAIETTHQIGDLLGLDDVIREIHHEHYTPSKSPTKTTAKKLDSSRSRLAPVSDDSGDTRTQLEINVDQAHKNDQQQEQIR